MSAWLNGWLACRVLNRSPFKIAGITGEDDGGGCASHVAVTSIGLACGPPRIAFYARQGTTLISASAPRFALPPCAPFP